MEEVAILNIQRLCIHQDLTYVQQGLSLLESSCESFEDFERYLTRIDAKFLWVEGRDLDAYKRNFKKYPQRDYIVLWILAEYCKYNQCQSEIEYKITQINSWIPDNFYHVQKKSLIIGQEALFQPNSPLPECTFLKDLLIQNIKKDQFQFPPWLFQMKHLESISLSDLNLKEIPHGLGQLHNLQMIDVSGNQIQKLPVDWNQLPLQRCILRENPRLQLGRDNHLTALELDGEQFTKNQSTICQMTSLRSLVLSFGDLTELPQTIRNLQQLETLDLGCNAFTKLPSNIGALTALKELDLSSNQLTKVPSVIQKLSNLEILSLSDNELETLPAFLSNLAHLKILNIRDVTFAKPPKVLSQLKNIDIWIS